MSTTLRKVTVRGVGSSESFDDDSFDIDDAFNDDIFEKGPISGSRARVSCPPPSGPTASSRYSMIAERMSPRRRETLSMLAVPLRGEEDVSKAG